MNTQPSDAPTPVKTVLRGNNVTVKRPKKKWTAGMFMVLGILMIISGGMISVTVGSIVAKIGFMIGLAIFTLALLVRTIDLAMRIYYEGREND
jgi:hypothetical protein